jgi:alkylresorcinol/alkylpyrone synthase
MPQIASTATAVPGHRLEQRELQELAAKHFAAKPKAQRYLSVFDNALVDERYFCVPASWFIAPASIGESNRIYLRHATELGVEVATACLARASLHPSEVDGIVFASSSGIATPSLDTEIANALSLRRDIQRIPLFGLGCAGGAAALAIAARLARASPHARFLVVALELNSLTFQRDDFSTENLIATALFSDGAAAVLVTGDDAGGGGPLEILRSATIRYPGSADLMGWDFGDNGFRVMVSQRIPEVVRDLIPDIIHAFGDLVHLEKLNSFILHPGGAKILRVFEDVLQKPAATFAESYEVLARYGNMSSPTVLFVLDSKVRLRSANEDGYSLLAAFGPGFTAEASLLRWAAR